MMTRLHIPVTSMRIGAVCRDTLALCPDSPVEKPHGLDNCQFLTLVWMQTGNEMLPPFSGSQRDPAVEAEAINVPDPQAARGFLSIVYYN